MRRKGGERGFALVITLIITALLVALAVEFIDEVYVGTTSSHNFVDAQQASLMANSGVEGAVKLLQMALSTRTYTTLEDQWAKPLQLEDEKGTLRVTIEDEGGKFNINSIAGPNGNFLDDPYATASRLFKKEGLSPDLLDAVADWIDENDEPHPGGAETPYYSALKQPYAAKNQQLETFEELALVKGFDRKALAKLRPLITVYSDGFSHININTAPKDLLAALTDSDELAQRIIDYRLTTPFKTESDIMKVPGMETAGTALMGKITTKGTIYRVFSVATVNETTRTVEAVVQIGLEPPYLYWREF